MSPTPKHLVIEAEQSAATVTAVCGKTLSTWDMPVHYVFDRARVTCETCLEKSQMHARGVLPQNDAELRDWLTRAWEDGWAERGKAVGRPSAVMLIEKPKRLAFFLKGWDL